MNVSTATTAELLAFFNANTGGAQVKKFADRKTAERRVQALVDEMAAETTAMVAANPDYQEAAEASIVGEFVTCPCCGIHLSNGYTTYDDLKADKGNHSVDLSDMTHEYMCLGCCGYFGPELVKSEKKASVSTGKVRPAMVATMKIDRQIVSVATGIVYKNACQVWKAGLVSASQGDRLSAVLYGAAKAGNRLMSITLNGHVFALAVK